MASLPPPVGCRQQAPRVVEQSARRAIVVGGPPSASAVDGGWRNSYMVAAGDILQRGHCACLAEIRNCTDLSDPMQVVDSPRLLTQGGAPTPLRRSGRQLPPPIAEAGTPSLGVVAETSGDHASSGRLAFGRRLQAAREQRGVSLQEIAQATKVSATLLAALERGDASRWPKGLFRRAFFRETPAPSVSPSSRASSSSCNCFPTGSITRSRPLPSIRRRLRRCGCRWRREQPGRCRSPRSGRSS